jgi:beta-mannanase
MRKFTISRLRSRQAYNVQFTIAVLFTFYILHSTFYIPVNAQEASKSASPSADLTSKINQIKQEIASKAASLKQEINQKMQNKVYAGTLNSKSGNQLAVQGANDSHQILVNEYTTYDDQTKKNKNPGLDSMQENQSYIIALGDVDDKNILTAKKIIITKPIRLNKKIVWGQVQSLNGTNIIIKTKDNKNLTVESSDETHFDLNNQDATIKDVKQNKFLVAVGTGTSSLEADYIHLIASTGYYKPSKTPSPTPSLSPKPKINR